ncbi:MAG: V-type ATPase subunit [Deltaproteobacteria bacterium]|jgi:hypothetical protein|nr:V-type ATPase subunit [Deltaproteobacteria bacterium]
MSSPGLLKKLNECDYPEEFLVARLHGKKGGLFRNWEFLISSSNPVEQLQDSVFYPYLKKYAAPGIWRFLYNEHFWIYKRMNRKLRKVFGPYFIYHESNTLIQNIRNIYNNKEAEIITRQLDNSLLGDDLQEILAGNLLFPDMLNRLESCLASKADCFQGLNAHYEIGGILALEMFLREKIFSLILQQRQSSLLRVFFQYLIDFHNCIALAKNIRWEIADDDNYINGGNVEPDKFKRIYFRKDLFAVLKLFPIQAPAASVSSVAELEKMLLSLITKVLRRCSRQRTIVSEILDYLWEQYRYARNISMVLNTMQLEDDTVRESLIA